MRREEPWWGGGGAGKEGGVSGRGGVYSIQGAGWCPLNNPILTGFSGTLGFTRDVKKKSLGDNISSFLAISVCFFHICSFAG